MIVQHSPERSPMIRSFSLSLAQKYLDPGESLGEVLFGLIMTLTFTLAAGLMVQEGPDAVRELLIATIGCNISWGIIDGALHVSGQVFERGRLARLGQLIRGADTEGKAAAIVEQELESLIGDTGDAADRADLHQRIARHVRGSRLRPSGVTRADLYGALASFWLVFFASIPAALPFLFIDEARTALRVSNGILIFLLFLAGYRWARYTTLRPWATGLTLAVAGVGLVAITIALGG
jgi:VIT1/CCC1 family predicted Fe2+/Mn2+ transporter